MTIEHPYTRFTRDEIEIFERDNKKGNRKVNKDCSCCNGFGAVVDMDTCNSKPSLRICGCYKPVLKLRR